MKKGKWYEGPDWLLNEEDWPDQPKLERTRLVDEEHKPVQEEVLYSVKREPDQWDALLSRSTL